MDGLELWASIGDAPGYEVSTWGRVRCGDEVVESWPNAKGYHLVTLEVGERSLLRYVHRLVLAAFDGPPAGRQGNHDDGNKGHNALANLGWTTASENVRHAWSAGLIPRRRRPRLVCRHGHRLDQRYVRVVAGGVMRPAKRCSRCRRAGYWRRQARDRGLARLPLDGDSSAEGGTSARA